MGALVTKALRPIRSFNIENRAHRVISREKPVPAPRYPTNIEDLKRTLEAEPDIDKKLNTKDPELDNWLKNVYVTTIGKPEDDITRALQKNNPNRPLPEDRKQPEDFQFGFPEPERITYGKTTLRNTINFISAHQSNPAENTAAKIASEYKLKLEDVEDILKYYKTFEVYLPATKKTPATFAGPATSRRQLEHTKVQEIEAKKEQQEEKIVFLRKEIDNEGNEIQVVQKGQVLLHMIGTDAKEVEQKDSIEKNDKNNVESSEKLELQNK